jgi:hypothetical protein
MEAAMTQPDTQHDTQQVTQQDIQAQPTDPRADNLLPADDAEDDGRFEVAEEVSLDQQSDTLHHVGEIHAGDPADALADTLKKDAGA